MICTEITSLQVSQKFADKFDICKYFPGYVRNKQILDKLKGYNLNARQFDNMITGKNDVIKGLDYYLSEIYNHKIVNDEESDNKVVEFEMEYKEKAIDIIVKTKQEIIDDAWTVDAWTVKKEIK